MITTAQKENVIELLDKLDDRDFAIVYGMISNMLSLDDIETADDYKAYQESTKESVFTRHEDFLKELL